MIVQWRVVALEERDELFDYVAADDPTAALALDDKIDRQVSALIDQPELYKIGRVKGTREMVLTSHYILVYRIKKRAGVIEIIRIIGTRQDYPRTPKE